MNDHIIVGQVAHFDYLVGRARHELRVSCEDHKENHAGHSMTHCADVVFSYWQAKTARLLRDQIIRTSGYRRPVAA